MKILLSTSGGHSIPRLKTRSDLSGNHVIRLAAIFEEHVHICSDQVDCLNTKSVRKSKTNLFKCEQHVFSLKW